MNRDITERKFGRLLAITKVKQGPTGAMWLCRCDCGKERIVRIGDLSTGHTQSCGCLSIEKTIQRSTTHGLKKDRAQTKEYTAWINIRQRCYNPHNISYRFYGQRGITVCDEWMNDFMRFLNDMGPAPNPKSTIERIDNNQGYSKSNCRWATTIEQGNNKRSNVVLEHKGESKTLTQWARLSPVTVRTFGIRVRRLGWPLERALREPSRTETKT